MCDMAKKLLITGGAGFIGINSARHFLARGFDVTLFDNFSRKGTDINVANLQNQEPKVAVVRGDIRTDQALLDAEIAKADAVLHLAAQVAVTTSITDPRRDFEDNILGTFNVLEAIRKSAGKPPIIFSSTNKVYGALEHHPVREEETRYSFEDEALRTHGVGESEKLDFHSPYGCSKGAADQYVIDYARIYGLKSLVFRQSCVYGEQQFGVEDQGWVAWFTIAAMLDKPLTLYGSGKQVRDILFMDDLAKLYELGFEKINTLSPRAYNVGGGPLHTLSLLELLSHLNKSYGLAPNISHAEIRAGDQPIFVADIRALEKDLGWKPAVTPPQGIGNMRAWLTANLASVKKVFGA